MDPTTLLSPEDEAQPARDPRSRLIALLLLVLVLLLVVAVLRGGTVSERAEEQVDPDLHLQVPLPADRGDPKAKVNVEVLYSTAGPCRCDGDAAIVGLALAELEPERVHYTFVDTNTAQGKWRGRELTGKPSGVGFAINGRVTFTVPLDPPQPGHRTAEVTLVDSTSWSVGDLWSALDQTVKEAGESGLSHSRDEFVQAMTPLTIRLREEIKSKGIHSGDLADNP